MARYQVILAYDGTLFAGFQRQRRARTVQGEFEKALQQLGWTGRSILSSGRTDTGVHASGQVVAFDLDWKHSPQELLQALNARLPEDVAARSVRTVMDDFHPRYDARARHYRYRIICQAQRNPLEERYAWRVWPAARLDRLEVAARGLTGTYDFAAFGSPPLPKGSTIRTVLEAGWQSSGEALVFDVTANAFLYHMVRRLVFIQVLIGQGKAEPETFWEGLRHQVPQTPGLAAPQGLTLVEVIYPPFDRQDNLTIYAEGSNDTLAASGDDNRGQDLRP